MTDPGQVDLREAVRGAWHSLAPPVTWRGRGTGWNALDLLELGEVVHRLLPAAVVVAGGLGEGGLPTFLADCLDNNRRGKLLAGESMGPECRRAMPEHRRIQWVPADLVVDDLRTAERLTAAANPVLVVASPAALSDVAALASLTTVGSYLVIHGVVAGESRHAPEDRFIQDPSRDPVGLSACSWLLRVPA